MHPLGPRLWTTLLLLSGGVLLGILGVRHLLLEREQAAARADTAEQRALAHAVADAPRLAHQPRGGPAAAWQLEPGRLIGTEEVVAPELLAALRRAEVPGLAPDVGLQRWAPLAAPRMPTWLRHIASYHAALAALRVPDPKRADAFLAVASQAHPLLVSGGVRVRAAAMKARALRGLQQGTLAPLESFLDLALDGKRLVLGDVVGPDDLLSALALYVEAEGLTLPSALRRRLALAADRARRGMNLLRHVPLRGNVALVAGQVVLRTEHALEVRDKQSLVAPPPGFPGRARVVAAPPGVSLPSRGARLAVPFERLAVIVEAQPLAKGTLLALLGLALGLGFYGVGTVLALRGWRRSRRAERMQADFTAAVSHEMKTPIASVRAMAEFLGDGEADPERTRRYAGRIEAEMQRLGGTVRNVLDAAQIERGLLPVHLRPADPAALLEEIAEAARPALARAGFTLELDIEPAQAPLPVDSDALRGVLQNLLDNAVKYSGAPSSGLARSIRIEGRPRLRGYAMAVLDRGIGIDPSQHQRLFERFYRGAAAREGAVPGVGLGLYIAKQMIEAHGGTLTACDRAGGGAVFEVDLPAGIAT